jgi:hypothetical protein
MDSVAQVKVAVRVRPLTPKEHLQNTNECISYLPSTTTSHSHGSPSQGGGETLLLDSTRSFTFDYIFQPSSSQSAVFQAVHGMCSKFVDGFNTTVLAYGQTGSGKTFTMGTGLGSHPSHSAPVTAAPVTAARGGDEDGMVQMAVDRIFGLVKAKVEELGEERYKYSMAVTFLELYNEELIDLLNPHTRSGQRKGSSLTIREDSSGIHSFTPLFNVSHMCVCVCVCVFRVNL